MEVTSNIFLQIFAISVFVGIIAFFYSIFEYAMAIRFAPFVFENGLLFSKTTTSLRLIQSHIPADGKLETRTGQFRFINSRTCYFRPKWERRWLNYQPQVRTPFEIRGKISWQGDEAQIEVRFPFGAGIFFLCALVGTTAVCINYWINHSFDCGLSLLIGSWIFIGGMILFSIAYEYERTETIIGELKEYI